MASARLSRLFDEYAAYHRHPMNKLTHYIGVPLIIGSLVGLLWRVELGPVNLAVLVSLAAVIYDLRLSVKLTLPFAAFVALCFPFAPRLPVSVLWLAFFAGWGLQFAGHFLYEKRSPAFFDNLVQLLVGPLWLVHDAVERHQRQRSVQT